MAWVNPCKMLPDSDFNILRQDEPALARMCEASPLISVSPSGNKVVRLSDALVAKYGVAVRREEASNQGFARTNNRDPNLCVPMLLRFFEITTNGVKVGYMVSEFIHGMRLDHIDLSCNPDILQKVTTAIMSLANISIRGFQAPGPIGLGVAHGYLWSDEGAQAPFIYIEDMQNWMNERIARVCNEYLDLTPYMLTVRHMDLRRRNIMLLPDSTICFLDWAYAGFYPELFEISYLRKLYPQDPAWFEYLLSQLHQPTPMEERDLSLIALPATVSMQDALLLHPDPWGLSNSLLAPMWPPFPS